VRRSHCRGPYPWRVLHRARSRRDS
jgi:hypothetical protein